MRRHQISDAREWTERDFQCRHPLSDRNQGQGDGLGTIREKASVK